LQRVDVGREKLFNAFETEPAVKCEAHLLAKLFLSFRFKVIVGCAELAFAGVIACQLFNDRSISLCHASCSEGFWDETQTTDCHVTVLEGLRVPRLHEF